MPQTPSPLRYPGGKYAIIGLVEEIVRQNWQGPLQAYCEPYAGGGGLALGMLQRGLAQHIYLNDVDRAIWAFWHAVLHETEALIALIEQTEVTLEAWHRQRAVQERKEQVDPLTLGFSTLFLNRTNRSGVIEKAGVIGGWKQAGKYKLDCRFNKPTLIAKIRAIAALKDRIHLSQLDAADFIRQVDEWGSGDTLLMLDPPYYGKGAELYTSFYRHEDHAHIRDIMASCGTPWIMTYDDVEPVRALYARFNCHTYRLNYTAQVKRKAQELLILSDSLRLDPSAPVLKKRDVKRISKPIYHYGMRSITSCTATRHRTASCRLPTASAP